MSESFNMKVSVTNSNKREPCNFKSITVKKLFNYIDATPYDVELKNELKKSIGNYPQNALENWFENFDLHVSKARNKVIRNADLENIEEEL